MMWELLPVSVFSLFIPLWIYTFVSLAMELSGHLWRSGLHIQPVTKRLESTIMDLAFLIFFIDLCCITCIIAEVARPSTILQDSGLWTHCDPHRLHMNAKCDLVTLKTKNSKNCRSWKKRMQSRGPIQLVLNFVRSCACNMTVLLGIFKNLTTFFYHLGRQGTMFVGSLINQCLNLGHQGHLLLLFQ